MSELFNARRSSLLKSKYNEKLFLFTIEETPYEEDRSFSFKNDKRCRASTEGYDSPVLKDKKPQFEEYTCHTYNRINVLQNDKLKSSAQLVLEMCFINSLNRMKQNKLGFFLHDHDVSENMRARMIDWMIEVLKKYDQSDITIHRSVDLLDRYYNCSIRHEKVEDLHITGLVCMMIASKSEEVNYITTDSFIESIGKGKFTREKLLAKELEILKAVNFVTASPVLFNLLSLSTKLLNINDNVYNEFIEKSSLLLTNICLFSYQLVSRIPIEEIGLCSIIISLKAAEKLLAFKADAHVNL